MTFREELEEELKDYQRAYSIMKPEQVFLNEELAEIREEIERIQTILAVLKE